jgi:sugar (pentulose or hexulose) kinase
LLTVISLVFGAEVRSFEVKESAALGAAMRAAHAFLSAKGKPIGWIELFESVVRASAKEIIRPRAEAVEIYQGPKGLLNLYKTFEQSALA